MVDVNTSVDYQRRAGTTAGGANAGRVNHADAVKVLDNPAAKAKDFNNAVTGLSPDDLIKYLKTKSPEDMSNFAGQCSDAGLDDTDLVYMIGLLTDKGELRTAGNLTVAAAKNGFKIDKDGDGKLGSERDGAQYTGPASGISGIPQGGVTVAFLASQAGAAQTGAAQSDMKAVNFFRDMQPEDSATATALGFPVNPSDMDRNGRITVNAQSDGKTVGLSSVEKQKLFSQLAGMASKTPPDDADKQFLTGMVKALGSPATDALIAEFQAAVSKSTNPDAKKFQDNLFENFSALTKNSSQKELYEAGKDWMFNATGQKTGDAGIYVNHILGNGQGDGAQKLTGDNIDKIVSETVPLLYESLKPGSKDDPLKLVTNIVSGLTRANPDNADVLPDLLEKIKQALLAKGVNAAQVGALTDGVKSGLSAHKKDGAATGSDVSTHTKDALGKNSVDIQGTHVNFTEDGHETDTDDEPPEELGKQLGQALDLKGDYKGLKEEEVFPEIIGILADLPKSGDYQKKVIEAMKKQDSKLYNKLKGKLGDGNYNQQQLKSVLYDIDPEKAKKDVPDDGPPPAYDPGEQPPPYAEAPPPAYAESPPPGAGD